MSGLFFGGLFWGILISLIGLSIVLKYAFNIDLHLIRVFFGIVIILLGLKIITGYNFKHNIKIHRNINYYHGSKECTIVFSNGTIDLSKNADEQKTPREITVVFGNALVIVPDTMNLEITSTTVFGSTILPDRSYAGFGEDTYSIVNNPGAKIYKIETTTVFGKLEFEIIPIKNTDNTTVVNDSTKANSDHSY